MEKHWFREKNIKRICVYIDTFQLKIVSDILHYLI